MRATTKRDMTKRALFTKNGTFPIFWVTLKKKTVFSLLGADAKN